MYNHKRRDKRRKVSTNGRGSQCPELCSSELDTVSGTWPCPEWGTHDRRKQGQKETPGSTGMVRDQLEDDRKVAAARTRDAEQNWERSEAANNIQPATSPHVSDPVTLRAEREYSMSEPASSRMLPVCKAQA